MVLRSILPPLLFHELFELAGVFELLVFANHFCLALLALPLEERLLAGFDELPLLGLMSSTSGSGEHFTHQIRHDGMQQQKQHDGINASLEREEPHLLFPLPCFLAPGILLLLHLLLDLCELGLELGFLRLVFLSRQDSLCVVGPGTRAVDAMSNAPWS